MIRVLLLVLLVAAPAGAQPTGRAVDPDASGLAWRGTKFRGRGAHEGTLRVQDGRLTFASDGTLTGAVVRVALASLAITDIPAHEVVPRRRLRTHLLAEDFFWAARYPRALLRTTRVVRQAGGDYHVEALLTMRGLTRPISFGATVTPGPSGRVVARASLRLLRSTWGMQFGLFPGDDLFVDDPFALEVTLTTQGAPGCPPLGC